MVRILFDGVVASLAGLLLGAGAWDLTGNVWVTLPVCVIGTVLPLCWRRHVQGGQVGVGKGEAGVRTAGPEAGTEADTQARQLAASLDAERAQHEATRQFIQRLLDVVPMPIYVKDADSRVIIVNRVQAELWGASGEEVIGNQSFDLVRDPARTPLSLAEDQQVLAGEQIYKEERTVDSATGEVQFRVITKGRCEDSKGNYVIVCARFDTTQWRKAEVEVQQALEREKLLRQRNQNFIQRVLDVIPDPFYIKDGEGRLVMVNEAYARDRERTPESIVGMLATAVALNPELAGDVGPEDQAVLRGETVDKEQRYLVPHTGEERFRLVSKRPCNDMDGKPLIVVAHLNITRWKVAESKLARMAHEDELTSLPNRRRFLGEAERLSSIAARHGSPLALIMFDIDHFKQINDTHGHAIGDLALREVANRLMAHLRAEDLPCRWGGEEFVVLLPLTDVPMAELVAERLRVAVAIPIEVQGRSLSIAISGGITQKHDTESLNDCLDRADKALYAAKSTGRNRFVSA